MRNLWGERYFDAKARKWVNDRPTETAVNGFVQFVLEPIYRILRSTLHNSEDPLKLAEKLSISLSTEERLLKERDLLKVRQISFLLRNSVVDCFSSADASPLDAGQRRNGRTDLRPSSQSGHGSALPN